MRHFFQRLSAKVDAISPKIIILLLIFTLALLSVAAIVNAFIPDSTPTAPEASASSPPNLLPTIDFSQYEPTVQPSPTRPPPTNTPIPRTPPLTPGPEAGANFAAQPPTPTPTPTPPPTPPGQAGICKRTPEVQDAIIAAIAELGPRMSCQLINPSELYRIREMTVSETLPPVQRPRRPAKPQATHHIHQRPHRAGYVRKAHRPEILGHQIPPGTTSPPYPRDIRRAFPPTVPHHHPQRTRQVHPRQKNPQGSPPSQGPLRRRNRRCLLRRIRPPSQASSTSRSQHRKHTNTTNPSSRTDSYTLRWHSNEHRSPTSKRPPS